MVKLKTCFLFCLFSFSMIQTFYGQELVGSQGGMMEGSLGSLSWSLGEPITETLSGSSLLLNQGFQQNWNGNAGGELLFSNYLIETYPNPTFNELNIVPKVDLNSGEIIVKDATGRIVLQLSDQQFPLKIDMSKLNSGVFFISTLFSNHSPIIIQVIKL